MKALQLVPRLKPASAVVKIPGSKSYTNRALFLAALSGSKVKIINPLISDDTIAMLNCLKTLGVKIAKKVNCLEVSSDIKVIPNATYTLDANLSGTTFRFMLALSTIIPGTKIISGQEGLIKRPVKDLVSALTQLGAGIKYLKEKGYPPVKVTSSKLNPGAIRIKGSISSQYVSALLMIAPQVGGVSINVTENQVSKPYIDMTIDIMEEFGVKVVNKNYKKYSIGAGQKYKAKSYLVEGDLSSACYFLAVAAITKSIIAVKNINPSSGQADIKFIEILKDMGNQITFGKNQLTIKGQGIKPINADMEDCPDQIQTLAVLAAFANGISRISGISTLRIKETDRVFALRKELGKMDIKTSATKNILTIYGGDPKPAVIETYGDHRMAMAFAVAGTKLPGMEILDPDVVNKTFPDFWEKVKSIGVKTKIINNQKNIVLIGMRGSGKTTVSKILAKKLGRRCIETDEFVIQKANLIIPEIVKNYGWDKVRKLEHESVKDAVNLNKIIISTGGGVVINDKNIDLLKKNGQIFWLRNKISTLVKRIGNDTNRPPLTNKKTPREEMAEVLRQREKQYKKAADEIIDTDDLSPEEVADAIISQMKQPMKTCLVIGHPVKQSKSPVMHNAAFKALGIADQFQFLSKEVQPKKLKKIIEDIKNSNIKGISVTVPHKETVMTYLDKVDYDAENIGAVNTIVNTNGKLTGYNTDWIGAITPLEQRVKLAGKKVAVIGAGGVARAIIYGLKKKGAAVTIFNRTLDRAKALAGQFNCRYSGSLADLAGMDIIVNATSVGMDENKSLVKKEYLNKRQVVLDVVYSPKETRLIKDAKEKEAMVIYGYEMLLYQGVAQFELYTGIKAPVDIMREALEKDEN